MPEASSKQSYTLVEKLRQLVETKRGDPMPPFLAHATNQWGMVLADTARQALELIEGETDPRLAIAIDQVRKAILVGGGFAEIGEPDAECLIRAIINYRCRLATATALVKSLQDREIKP